MSYQDPRKITRKRTATGLRNPRLVKVMNDQALQAFFVADLEGEYKRFTKAEIAAQYPPEKVVRLLADADENLQRIMNPE